MGITDQRVIMIIKSMLKAGIMDECDVNEDGTPQGGILSPLLANVYLDILDEYVAKQWINKKTVHQYTRQESKTHALKTRSNLIPGVLVRYADDFVIITDSREHAHFWKERTIQRKEGILLGIGGDENVKAWTGGGYIGVLSKNKIHCSCWMCRVKSYDYLSQMDTRRIQGMADEEREWRQDEGTDQEDDPPLTGICE